MENLNKNIVTLVVNWSPHYEKFSCICRICLNRENLHPFVDPSLLNLFESITNMKIKPDDELPRNLCATCIQHLKNISTFIQLAKDNNVLLQQALRNQAEEIYSEDPMLGPDVIDDSVEYSSKDEKAKIKDSFSVNNVDLKEEPLTSNESNVNKRHSTKKQPSKCDICGEFFGTKMKLTDHQRKNSNCRTRQYKCVNCDKAFFTKFRLKIHMRSHTKETPFECKICLKKFRHSPNLKRHDNTVHKGLKPFKCDTCGKDFATFVRKTEHLRIHTGERPYICSYCGISFKKYSTRYAHEMRHKIKNGEIPKSDKKPKIYPRKKPENPSELECKSCKKIFSSKQALCVHSQIHIGEKSFLCTICGRGFHKKSHLEVHIRIHTGERPYKCNECGKDFRQAACYRNHLLIHKAERSHKCHVCQRTFIRIGHLQSHLKTHTGEKPYKCTFCGKEFARNGNLKTHTRIHTGELPYLCTICYMGFYDSISLNKHNKSHKNVEQIEHKFVIDNDYKIPMQL